MLIKEYRIPLPMTVEEYRIAQLYMIAKKSREESHGRESGVEILTNEPYEDGPGGKGQYTLKIYHVGSHLPSWFKKLLPQSALTVEEEAWNAYPYTKTRYKCPFVDKFSLEIETKYIPDGGHQDNVFDLNESEYRNRIYPDLIDVVRDQNRGDFADPEAEDPTIYVSSKTGRGPLDDDWIASTWDDIVNNGMRQPTPKGRAIMCAYKLCKVEFRYWGMQSKIEQFIHNIALRKTMLRAHSQAWTWQDEWHGLTMDDIRTIEKETALILERRMNVENGDEDADADEKTGKEFKGIEYQDRDVPPNIVPRDTNVMPRKSIAQENSIDSTTSASRLNRSKSTTNPTTTSMISCMSKPGRSAMQRRRTTLTQDSEDDLDLDDFEEEEEEFFDCRENLDETSSLAKWSSMELTPMEEQPPMASSKAAQKAQQSLPQIVTTSTSLTTPGHNINVRRAQSMRETTTTTSTTTASSGVSSCPTTILILVAHGGSVLDLDMEASVRKSDVTTFRGALESVMRLHYPSLVGHVVVKCVASPPICSEALALLSSLSPYSFDVSNEPTSSQVDVNGFFGVSNDHLPVGTIPLFACAASLDAEYAKSLRTFVAEANKTYTDFLASEEGQGFYGQVVLVGDSVGAILAYDALSASAAAASSTCSGGGLNQHDYSAQVSCNSDVTASGAVSASASTSGVAFDFGQQPQEAERKRSAIFFFDEAETEAEDDFFHFGQSNSRLSVNPKQTLPQISTGSSTSATSNYDDEHSEFRLDFDVSDFFAFGSPLGLVLAFRRMQNPSSSRSRESRSRNPSSSAQSLSSLLGSCVQRPAAHQVYNLFHPTDPLAVRIEPLLSSRFSRVPPVNVPRYHKYPMGDGASLSIIEFVQSNPSLFQGETPGQRQRRPSEESVVSGILDQQQIQKISSLNAKWWGPRRVDFALYCPEGLASFPTNSLPHLFHSSYWESADVIAFVLRQVVRPGEVINNPASMQTTAVETFAPAQPREKWNKKRSSVKIRNGAANHRGNDVIVREGNPQTLSAKFTYGPLDMSNLTGEKVDVYVMKEPPAGEWILVSTELTDKSGRVTLTLKEGLGFGVHPVRMLVRGDHTMMHMYLAVVPPKTETVVFSIDGSFAASVSVTGKDPKVKAGAVDIVRHWQELGYLIVYVTGRPDMQLQKVVSWLAQHNFPHGLVSFAEGFSRDPLGTKAEFLKGLKSDQDIVIHAAYGSSKDISVYASLGLRPDQIYVVGKASRKQAGQATHLVDGYSDHLTKLTAHGGSRPAQGNARMVIPKANFGLPGQNVGLTRRRTIRTKSAKRTTSFPAGVNPNGNKAAQSGSSGSEGGSSSIKRDL